jgi:hypothetical protein
MKPYTLKVMEVQALPVVVVPPLPFLSAMTALAHRCFATSACLIATRIILYTGLMYIHVFFCYIEY